MASEDLQKVGISILNWLNCYIMRSKQNMFFYDFLRIHFELVNISQQKSALILIMSVTHPENNWLNSNIH